MNKITLNRLLIGAVVITVCLLQLLQLQYSAWQNLHTFLFILNKTMIAVNFAAVFSFSWLLAIIINNWVLSLGISSVLCTVWAVTNYYVIQFHGSPLFFSEFANFFTAMDVAGNYEFKISEEILVILVFFFFELAGIVLLSNIRRKTKFYKSDNKQPSKIIKAKCVIGRLVLCMLLMASIVFFLLKEVIKPRSTMGLNWFYGIRFGYVTLIFEDIDNRINVIKEPSNYSAKAIEVDDYQITIDHYDIEEIPDIVLILNESFYDLANYSELETDTDYLKSFYEIENAIHGLAVQPTLGGGTNNTEFELLTSNSKYLLRIGAPFTYMSFKDDKNSIGKCLQEIGYTTAGMHCSVPTNYSRNKVYPLLGFDYVVQGKDNYHLDYYGNRPWLDSDNYCDLIDLYEKMSEQPRFMYMLTYQNHGGYNQNDSSLDTVHSLTDFGDLTEQVNEYLTSISMSADAFVTLIDYFKTVDRPVIVCMLGDHAPAFITEMSPKSTLSSNEEILLKQAVPYIIWANYDIKMDGLEDEWTSVIDIVPTIKKLAGLPLSVYDQIILRRHEAVPIFMSSGFCGTGDDDYFIYSPNDQRDETFLITQYLFAEYNLLSSGKDYMPGLFTVDK